MADAVQLEQTPDRLDASASGALRQRSRLLWLLGGFALLLVLVVPFDAALSAWIAGAVPPDTYLRRTVKLPNHAFKWYSFVALGVVLFCQQDWRRRLIAYVATIASCIAALHTIKLLVGRARPDLHVGPWCFLPLGDPSYGFDALPSGHTTLAALMTVLVFHYWRKAGFVVLPLAVLAAIGRVAQLRHFVTDVVAAVLLVLLAVYVARRVFGDAAFAPLGSWRRIAWGRVPRRVSLALGRAAG